MRTQTHTHCILACFIGMPLAASGALYECLRWPGVPWFGGSIFTAILLAFTVLAVMDTRGPLDIEERL